MAYDLPCFFTVITKEIINGRTHIDKGKVHVPHGDHIVHRLNDYPVEIDVFLTGFFALSFKIFITSLKYVQQNMGTKSNPLYLRRQIVCEVFF